MCVCVPQGSLHGWLQMSFTELLACKSQVLTSEQHNVVFVCQYRSLWMYENWICARLQFVSADICIPSPKQFEHFLFGSTQSSRKHPLEQNWGTHVSVSVGVNKDRTHRPRLGDYIPKILGKNTSSHDRPPIIPLPRKVPTHQQPRQEPVGQPGRQSPGKGTNSCVKTIQARTVYQ